MRRSFLAVAALVASVPPAGCGRSVDVAVLKMQLSGVADAIDRCVARTRDARRCVRAQALGPLPAGTTLGDGRGEIAISAGRPLRYALGADAGDDVRYSLLAAPVGARSRSCAPAGTGGCPRNGVW